MTQKIIMYSLAIVAFSGFIAAAHAGLSKTEKFECAEIEKTIRDYNSIKIETWMMKQCTAHGFHLSL